MSHGNVIEYKVRRVWIKPLKSGLFLCSFLFEKGMDVLEDKKLKPCKHRNCPLMTYDDYCEFHERLHINDKEDEKRRAALLKKIKRDRKHNEKNKKVMRDAKKTKETM